MEALIAIVIIIGLMELREYRVQKKLDVMIDQILAQNQALSQSIELLYKAQKNGELLSNMMSANADHVQAIKDILHEVRAISEKSESNSATVLREYELNGVPLGFQRKQPDYVEGL